MNTYLVFQGGRNLTQKQFDDIQTQRSLLKAAGFIHVCGGPGTDQSQWFKEGYDKSENKKLRSMSSVVEVSRTEKSPLPLQ
ncbi:MAG: hypothetical protein ACYTEQ_09455 [Planctomycetota bacterium]|jgi:hypothetical protein